MAINGKVLNGNVINGGDSRTFLQAISASTTSVVNALKSAGKYVTTNVDYSLVVLTDVAKHLVAISYMVSETVSIGKTVTKTLTYLSSSLASIQKSVLKILSYLSTSSSSISKALSKTISYLSTSVSSITKAITHLFSAISEVSVDSITKQVATTKTITSISVSSISKQVGKLITYLSTSVSTITKLVSKTLSYLSTSTVNIYKGFFVALTATTTSIVTIVKSVQKSFTTGLTSTVTIVKSVGKLVTTNVDHVIVVLTDIALHLVAISYMVTDTVTIGKALTKTVVVPITSLVNITSGRAKVLFIKVQGLTLFAGGAGAGFINGASINLAAINAGISNVVDYTNSYLVEIGKQVIKPLSILESSILTLLHQRGRVMAVVSTSTANLTKSISKTVSMVLSSIVTILTNYLPKFGAIFRDSIYAPVKIRVVYLVETRTLFLDSFKKRYAALVKSRTVSKTEDLNG
jgi:hypothetical protein